MSKSREEIEDFEDEEERESVVETVEDQADVVLGALLSELGGNRDYTINVYRSGVGRKTPFLFTGSVDEYTLGELQEKLRDEYGGGDFRIHIRNSKGLVSNKGISVEAPRKKEEGEKYREKDNRDSDRFTELMMMMQESQRESREQLQTMMVESANRQTDMLMRMMELNAANKSQKSERDIIDYIPLFKELFANDKKEENPLDYFFRGIEFGKEVGGNEDVLSTMAKSVLGPLTQIGLANQSQQNRPLLRAPVPAPKPQAPSAPESTAPQSEPQNNGPTMTPEQQQQMEQMQPYLRMLLTAAENGSDPYSYATMILDVIGDDAAATYIVPAENYNALMTQAPAEIQMHRQWFDSVRDVVVELLADSGESGQHVEQSGNVPETPYDERSGGEHDSDISDTDGEPPAS